MTDPVVVGVDAHGQNDNALDWAVAHACRAGQPLELLLALPSHTAGQPPSSAAARAGRQLLDGLTRELGAAHPDLAVFTRIVPGLAVSEALVHTQAALVVVGRRDRGPASRSMLGTSSRRVATGAAVPVVVVPDWWQPPTTTTAPVVVGLDLAERDHPALAFAFREAFLLDAPVRVVIGREYPQPLVPRPRGEDVLAPLQQAFPDVPVAVEQRDGHPADLLLAAGGQARLLVVGRGAPGGVSPWGSVARMVMHRAGLPVALVPTVPSDGGQSATRSTAAPVTRSAARSPNASSAASNG